MRTHRSMIVAVALLAVLLVPAAAHRRAGEQERRRQALLHDGRAVEEGPGRQRPGAPPHVRRARSGPAGGVSRCHTREGVRRDRALGEGCQGTRDRRLRRVHPRGRRPAAGHRQVRGRPGGAADDARDGDLPGAVHAGMGVRRFGRRDRRIHDEGAEGRRRRHGRSGRAHQALPERHGHDADGAQGAQGGVRRLAQDRRGDRESHHRRPDRALRDGCARGLRVHARQAPLHLGPLADGRRRGRREARGRHAHGPGPGLRVSARGRRPGRVREPRCDRQRLLGTGAAAATT